MERLPHQHYSASFLSYLGPPVPIFSGANSLLQRTSASLRLAIERDIRSESTHTIIIVLLTQRRQARESAVTDPGSNLERLSQGNSHTRGTCTQKGVAVNDHANCRIRATRSSGLRDN